MVLILSRTDCMLGIVLRSNTTLFKGHASRLKIMTMLPGPEPPWTLFKWQGQSDTVAQCASMPSMDG